MKERSIAIKLSDELIERADQLAATLGARIGGANVSRSFVLRESIKRGFELIESEERTPTKLNK